MKRIVAAIATVVVVCAGGLAAGTSTDHAGNSLKQSSVSASGNSL